MPSLKSFRNRIASVKSIRKITKAMQMVAASNLRRAQEAAEAARPYAEKMDAVIASLAGGLKDNPGAPALLTGTGKDASGGVVAIKRLGGVVIVQDEASSDYFGMPSAAINTGNVDFILPLDEIPAKLIGLVTDVPGRHNV